MLIYIEDGGEIDGSRVHFPLRTVKPLAELRRNSENSQWYSSIYEEWRPNIVEDIEKSDSKESA